MLIVMEHEASQEQIDNVIATIKQLGYTPAPIPGSQRTAIGILGNAGPLDPSIFLALDGVKEAIRVSKPYKLVSREVKPENTIVAVGTVGIGGPDPVIIAGPCAVESLDQCLQIAHAVKATGAHLFRAGAFKPRTSPYSFQGLGQQGLDILARVRAETGLGIVTEAVDHEVVPLVEEVADIIQIGARNMQNFSLLRRVGKCTKPVLLKRGMSATIEEFLMAAEYIAAEGNHRIILCERGVRTFADHSRNTLDLSAVPAVKTLSHLPIIVDPSHAAGKRDQVIPLACAAIAVGADGIMVEVHHDPKHALSDGPQSLFPHQFEQLMQRVRAIAAAQRAFAGS
ncbi:MAG: 3-deoxy-7-phosphoheptulonate synthase [Desulfobacterota bacterium]|nr:3-deoxy-7-phosphoheptulonate synthase [Thermodesulfobacteriota bacterium]